MNAPFRPFAIAALALALAASALAAPKGGVGQPPPRIVGAEYYEDLEDGKRYNVLADVSRKPDRVIAKSGRIKAEGRRSDRIGPGGGPRKGKSWFFRQKRFVDAVRADLDDDGVAMLKVQARNEAGVARKLCTLRLERDDAFGDFAGGDCKKI
jgi:hypothetical protein